MPESVLESHNNPDPRLLIPTQSTAEKLLRIYTDFKKSSGLKKDAVMKKITQMIYSTS